MESLILSGGGAFGSFEGGVIYELMSNGYHWDKVYGSSAGSFNTLLIAQAYIDNSPEIIKTTWTKTVQTTDQIYSKNNLNWLISSPPYSCDPLRKLFKEIVDFEKISKLKEKFTVTTCDLISGQSVFFSNKDTVGDFFEATIASASTPILFDPVQLNSMRLVDGGLKNNLPISQAIEEYENGQMLAILCFPYKIDPSNKPFTGVIEIALSSIDILLTEITIGNLNFLLTINSLLKNIDEKNRNEFFKDKKIIDIQTIAPSCTIPGDLMDFSSENLRLSFEIGRDSARQFIDSTNNDKTIDESIITPELLGMVSSDQAQTYQIFPVAFDKDVLTVACGSALDPNFKSKIEIILGRDVNLVLVNKENLEEMIHKYY